MEMKPGLARITRVSPGLVRETLSQGGHRGDASHELATVFRAGLPTLIRV